MTIKDLKEHSDQRDDVQEKKIDDIDDFLRNGLSEKIIKGITDYLDRRTAVRVRLFFKIFVTALIISLVGGGIGLFVFGG